MNMKRHGPSPIPVHMSLAAQAAQKSGELYDLQKMLAGIKRYQEYEDCIPRYARETVWKKGSVSIKICGSKKESAATILLIPSLINKSDILDLCEEQSLAQWLSVQGYNVYLLDWGNICADHEAQNLDDVIHNRLVPVMEYIQEQHDHVAALGYCMGGVLLAAAAQQTQQKPDALIFLAVPWNFHTGRSKLRSIIAGMNDLADSLMAEKKYLPVDWLQSVFAQVEPDMTIRKFSKFVDMESGSREETIFIAVEDWVNDGVDLPKDIAKTCLDKWFGKNYLIQRKWRIDGKIVQPESLEMPALVATSRLDMLVEYESAMALADQLPHVEILIPDCGHIGMIAGQKCIEQVWRPMHAWLQTTLAKEK